MNKPPMRSIPNVVGSGTAQMIAPKFATGSPLNHKRFHSPLLDGGEGGVYVQNPSGLSPIAGGLYVAKPAVSSMLSVHANQDISSGTMILGTVKWNS